MKNTDLHQVSDTGNDMRVKHASDPQAYQNFGCAILSERRSNYGGSMLSQVC